MILKKIYLYIVVAVLVVMMASVCYAESQPLPKPLGELTKEDVISQYFKDKTVDLVEGIWITTDNKYEFAIVKNTSAMFHEYDYIGIVTSTTQKEWERGEVKVMLKRTSSGQLYTGNYYLLERTGGFWGSSSQKKEYGTTFSLQSKNLIECYLPIGAYGLPVKNTFIRTYPAYCSPGGAGLQASGTGFFVTKTLVATNYHVVADAKEIEVTFQNTTKLPAVVVAKDPANDLALLKVDGLEDMVTPVAIGASKEVKEGIQVFTVGFPLAGEMGGRAKIGEGIINSVTGLDDDIRMLQISIPIQPGNSGGPIYNTKGQVIGIVTSTLNNRFFLNRMDVIPQNVNYGIKISYLNMVINTLPGDIKLSETPDAAQRDASQVMDIAKQSVVFVAVKN